MKSPFVTFLEVVPFILVIIIETRIPIQRVGDCFSGEVNNLINLNAGISGFFTRTDDSGNRFVQVSDIESLIEQTERTGDEDVGRIKRSELFNELLQNDNGRSETMHNLSRLAEFCNQKDTIQAHFEYSKAAIFAIILLKLINEVYNSSSSESQEILVNRVAIPIIGDILVPVLIALLGITLYLFVLNRQNAVHLSWNDSSIAYMSDSKYEYSLARVPLIRDQVHDAELQVMFANAIPILAIIVFDALLLW